MGDNSRRLTEGGSATKIASLHFRNPGLPSTDISESESTSIFQTPLVHEFESSPDVADALAKFSQQPHCLLLESSRRTVTASGQQLGRYSFLMADPMQWIECRRVDDADLTLARLDDLLKEHRTAAVESLPPMQGGIAGLFSYDLNRAFEKVPAAKLDEFETPLIAVGLYDVVLAWDHEQEKAWLITQHWNHDATQRQEHYLNLLNSASGPQKPSEVSQNVSTDDSQDPANEGHRIELAQLQNQYPVPGPIGLLSNFSKDDYLAAVARSIEYIYAGDIFQVNLAQRLAMEADGSSVDLYLRLRQRNPAPFGGYFDFGHGQIVSASPERLVSISDRKIETRPIKGTRVRTGQPVVDINARRKLQASEKDRAENTMIVDLMRNDLSRICTDDSVTVTQLCEIEQYQSVMHLVSAVEGKLREHPCRISDLLKAIFPGGSITGAPKVRAMEIIAELEPNARGAYCGSLGYFAASGDADLNILIRTITASKGVWQIPVGGGIVSQSIPRLEYEETWTKAAGMLAATRLHPVDQRSNVT
ncbi:aminodeoxychorismate synthase component I [Mariniblastus fucicola]|uniref:aminodeoxychorismate synthase component I n=1 Tax=Mariniblastus fucicola TaxID=980251 RepID=UPI001EE4196D|nr:aminodeoxychorismate synthase component I [Mariniblastus fucicola]